MAEDNAPKKTGHISRAQMEAHINRGGGVIYGDKVITKVAELPSEADIAVKSGNVAIQAQTSDSLDAEIARLTAERDKLNAAPPAASKEPEEPADDGKDKEPPKGKDGGKP